MIGMGKEVVSPDASDQLNSKANDEVVGFEQQRDVMVVVAHKKKQKLKDQIVTR